MYESQAFFSKSNNFFKILDSFIHSLQKLFSICLFAYSTMYISSSSLSRSSQNQQPKTSSSLQLSNNQQKRKCSFSHYENNTSYLSTATSTSPKQFVQIKTNQTNQTTSQNIHNKSLFSFHSSLFQYDNIKNQIDKQQSYQIAKTIIIENNYNFSDLYNVNNQVNIGYSSNNISNNNINNNNINNNINNNNNNSYSENSINSNNNNQNNSSQDSSEDYISITNDSSTSSSSSSYITKYKTQPCKNYSLLGYCSYGERCQFAHGNFEMNPAPCNTLYKTKKCKNFWKKGFCLYGFRCQFLHSQCKKRQTLQNNSTEPKMSLRDQIKTKSRLMDVLMIKENQQPYYHHHQFTMSPLHLMEGWIW